MMFTPTSYPRATYDPIERERIESGRPASHLEVIQRQRQHMIHDVLATGVNRDEQPARDQRSEGSFFSDAMTGIRRSLSRVLIDAGERLDPEAA